MDSEDLLKGLDYDVTGQRIQVKAISFDYIEEEPVLKNIQFETNPGEVITFAVPSGSEKTTMFSLLERYYTPQKEEIVVGDIPLIEISLNSWWSQIGYVPQESALFSGKIRDNLTYGLKRDVSENQLWQVAKLAYAEEFIRALPQMMNTEVCERGMKPLPA